MRKPKSFGALWLRGWGWVAVIAALMAAFCSIFWYVGARDGGRLEAGGVETTAVIERKDRRRQGSSDTKYSVYYTFEAGGVPVRDRQDVGLAFYREVEEGDRVPVRYWREDPTVSEISFGSASVMGRIGFWLTAICGGIAAWAGLKATRKARRLMRLRDSGFRRQVVVEAHVDTHVKVNDVPHWKATWREPDGRSGETLGQPREALPAVGDEITILIDPDGKGPGVWEGDVTA